MTPTSNSSPASTDSSTRIAVVVGSVRPARKGDKIARWVRDTAQNRAGVRYELVDVQDYGLPHLDEPIPPMSGQYAHRHTQAWAATIAGYDGYVFVTPEYNHSTSAALKNALDYLYAEWNDKACGFVGYGVSGGLRAVEHLRAIAAELQMASVRSQVSINLFHDLDEDGNVRPGGERDASLHAMLDQLERWTTALAPLRAS